MELFRLDGVEEGREIGREEGEDRMAAVINYLIANDRTDEISKVTQDKGYYKKVYQEFNPI